MTNEDLPVTETGELDEEKIQTNAKKNFSLRDRIRGMKVNRESVIVFLDMPAAKAFGAAQQELANTTGVIESLGRAKPENDEERAVLKGRIAVLKKQQKSQQESVGVLREAALANSVGLTLRSVPEVAYRRAQRLARSQYNITEASVPPELADDYAVAATKHTLTEGALESIRFPEADEAVSPSQDDIEALVDELPPSQWQRINIALNKVMFIDGLEAAATDEPGF